jgi:predicted DNA-binding transcriptional regulator AlpA
LIDDRLLKIGECLKIIPIGKSTWWERVKDGLLPQPVHIRSSVFWRHSELMAFVADLAAPQLPPEGLSAGTPQNKAHTAV